MRYRASEVRFQAKGLGKCGAVVMHLAIMVANCVKEDVREWYPSTTASNLSIPKVPEPDVAAISACAKSSPKPGEHVQFFKMKRDRNKGFCSEKY